MKKELELTDDMLQRNDEIDNAAHAFACTLAEKELEWDMSIIGEVTDSVKLTLNNYGIVVRHPGITFENDGTQRFDDGDPSSVAAAEEALQVRIVQPLRLGATEHEGMDRKQIEDLLIDILVHGKDHRNEFATITREGDGLIRVHCNDGTDWNVNITR
jgi:hypothetical protein